MQDAELRKLANRCRRYGFRSPGELARALCRLFITATDGHESDTASVADCFRELSDAQATDYGNKPVRHNNSDKYV